MEEKIKKLIKKENINEQEIHCIYIYGSHLYQSSSENSDLDLTIIMENINTEMKQVFIDNLEYSIHFLSLDAYKEKIKTHEIDIIQSLWIPKDLIFFPSESFLKFQKNFVIDLELLIRATIQCAIGCRAKSKHNFLKNRKLSLKNLVHGLRYLLFASQVIKTQGINDYSEGNKYLRLIFDQNYKEWKEYDDIFFPISDKLKEKMLDELEQERDKYKNLKVKELIEKNQLIQLKRLFSIEFMYTKEEIILEKTEFSYQKYPIVNDHFPFILDQKDLNIIGCGIKPPLIFTDDTDLGDCEIYKYYMNDLFILFFNKKWKVYGKDEKIFWKYWNQENYKLPQDNNRMCFGFQIVSESLFLCWSINLKEFTMKFTSRDYKSFDIEKFLNHIDMKNSLVNIQEHMGYILKSSKNLYIFQSPISTLKLKKDQILSEYNIDQYLNIIKFHQKNDLDRKFICKIYQFLSESYHRLCKELNDILKNKIKEERDIFHQKWRNISKYLLEMYKSNVDPETYFRYESVKNLKIVLEKFLGVNKQTIERKVSE